MSQTPRLAAESVCRNCRNHLDRFCQTTAEVFQEDGYVAVALAPSAMVFQKNASRGASMAYSGVASTYYGAATILRVKAAVVEVGDGAYRLECIAFMVRNANDSFFAEEPPVSYLRSGPYQKPLKKVSKRLN